MVVLLISDKEYQTETFLRLNNSIKTYLKDKKYEIDEIQIGRNDLAYCMGCFGCWVKKPGECVINDKMTQINRSYINSDAVIYLSPVIFGQFSANMKNAVDRWIPNLLPFFKKRPDGSTKHPSRYKDYPKHVFIGYGEDLTAEDTALFSDIILKHRANVEVMLYQGRNDEIIGKLEHIELKKAGEPL